MTPLGKLAADTQRCVFCGKYMAARLKQCPFCREAVPQVHLSRRTGPDGRRQIQRGLLYMLLAGVIHYFAGGYIMPIQLPILVLPLVTDYLSPLLFLGGLGLTIYGLFLRIKS